MSVKTNLIFSTRLTFSCFKVCCRIINALFTLTTFVKTISIIAYTRLCIIQVEASTRLLAFKVITSVITCDFIRLFHWCGKQSHYYISWVSYELWSSMSLTSFSTITGPSHPFMSSLLEFWIAALCDSEKRPVLYCKFLVLTSFIFGVKVLTTRPPDILCSKSPFLNSKLLRYRVYSSSRSFLFKCATILFSQYSFCNYYGFFLDSAKF